MPDESPVREGEILRAQAKRDAMALEDLYAIDREFYASHICYFAEQAAETASAGSPPEPLGEAGSNRLQSLGYSNEKGQKNKPLTCTFMVAGAGFEPTTSRL